MTNFTIEHINDCREACLCEEKIVIVHHDDTRLGIANDFVSVVVGFVINLASRGHNNGVAIVVDLGEGCILLTNEVIGMWRQLGVVGGLTFVIIDDLVLGEIVFENDNPEVSQSVPCWSAKLSRTVKPIWVKRTRFQVIFAVQHTDLPN